MDLASPIVRRIVLALLANLDRVPRPGEALELGPKWAVVVGSLSNEQRRLDKSVRAEQLVAVTKLAPEQSQAIAREALREAARAGTSVPIDMEEALVDIAAILPTQVLRRTEVALHVARERGIDVGRVLPLDDVAFPEVECQRFYRNLLPPRRPRFRIGEAVPQRADWRFDGWLGNGGFGEVWRIHHGTGAQVEAIKFCLDPTSKGALEKEAGTLRTIQQGLPTHPNIVNINGFNVHLEPFWISLEYVPGGTLEDMIRGYAGTMPLDESLRLFAGACKAAAAAHELGVVHRDIKPANILVDATDGTPKLTDFGLGRMTGVDGVAPSGAASGGVGGTSYYMSIEQKEGRVPDPSDDAYSLGVLLYQLLIGSPDKEPPRHLRATLENLRPQPPVDVIDLVVDCLDKPRGQRPRNAEALLRRLAPHLPPGETNWNIHRTRLQNVPPADPLPYSTSQQVLVETGSSTAMAPVLPDTSAATGVVPEGMTASTRQRAAYAEAADKPRTTEMRRRREETINRLVRVVSGPARGEFRTCGMLLVTFVVLWLGSVLFEFTELGKLDMTASDEAKEIYTTRARANEAAENAAASFNNNAAANNAAANNAAANNAAANNAAANNAAANNAAANNAAANNAAAGNTTTGNKPAEEPAKPPRGPGWHVFDYHAYEWTANTWEQFDTPWNVFWCALTGFLETLLLALIFLPSLGYNIFGVPGAVIGTVLSLFVWSMFVAFMDS